MIYSNQQEVRWNGPIAAPFKQYGGKVLLASRIVSLFPRHRAYVEPFIGAGSVLFQKQPAQIEVINDADANQSDLFRWLQEPNERQRLRAALADMPNTAEQYAASLAALKGPLSALDRRRHWFFIKHTSYNAVFAGGWSRPTRPSDEKVFYNRLTGFEAAGHRIANVTIRNEHFRNVLPDYSASDTLIYADPPYLPDTRVSTKRYPCEMTEPEHEELLDLLSKLKSMIILSGYSHPLYESNLRLWHQREIPVVKHAGRSGNGRKNKGVEVLWLNEACMAATSSSEPRAWPSARAA